MNELADRPPLDPKHQIKKMVAADPQTDIETAAALEVTVEEANTFVSQHLAEMTAEATRAQLAGKTNVPKAYRIVSKLLDIIESGTVGIDAFEAADLLKQPLRILEAHDRVRLAERDKTEILPVFNFIFHSSGGGMRFESVSKPADIVDIMPCQGGGNV